MLFFSGRHSVNAIIAAAIGGAGAILLAVALLRGGERYLPAKESLQVVSGRLVSHVPFIHPGGRTSTRRDHIHMVLEGSQKIFERRRDAIVWNALCDGCKVTFWLDGTEHVWQLEVNDRVVHSYEAERQYQLDRRKSDGLWYFWVCSLFCIFMLGLAYFHRQRERIS